MADFRNFMKDLKKLDVRLGKILMTNFGTTSAYRSKISSSLFSTTSNSNNANQSKLEKLHSEAKMILTQKANEISQINQAIEKAEEQLNMLRSELASKTAEMTRYQENDFESINTNENQILEMVEEEHRSELLKVQTKNEEELNVLKAEYQKSLKEAEDWADKHAKSVAAERSAQLDQLRKEVDQMRTSTHEAQFTANQSRTKMYQQSKNASFQNSQRIQLLESQLSEIVSLTREDMRDIRAKIDECLATIEIRNKEYANDISRYEHELSERETQYNEHLQVLQEQFSIEKKRIEQSVVESSKKTENLQKMLKQLEKQHAQQLQTTLKDIEQMKNSIYQAKTREDQQMNETKVYIAQSQSIQRECQQTEQEIAIVEKELKELREENQELRTELSHLDKEVYSKTPYQ